jgi:PEP-CTERM motif
MRKALFALSLLASSLILPRTAHADTLTFIVSVVASGYVGNDTFTDQRVTLTASVPEQDLLETFSESGDNPASFATCAIPTSTATVQGIGNIGGAQLTCVVHNYEDSSTYLIFDGDGGLGIQVPLAFDSFAHSVGPVPGNAYSGIDSCDPEDPYPCPPEFAGMTLTSYEANTGYSELLVTSDTPEPSTFVLLGTGLLGIGSLVRRVRST